MENNFGSLDQITPNQYENAKKKLAEEIQKYSGKVNFSLQELINVTEQIIPHAITVSAAELAQLKRQEDDASPEQATQIDDLRKAAEKAITDNTYEDDVIDFSRKTLERLNPFWIAEINDGSIRIHNEQVVIEQTMGNYKYVITFPRFKRNQEYAISLFTHKEPIHGLQPLSEELTAENFSKIAKEQEGSETEYANAILLFAKNLLTRASNNAKLK